MHIRQLLSWKTAAVGLTSTLSLLTVWRYRSGRRRVLARLSAEGQVIATARGPIEYQSSGNGPALVVLHSSWGGYDQGMALSSPLQRSPLRRIAISRPGYLRTPLGVGRTPEEQADAIVALLDTLDIGQAAVMGVSLGGAAAIQFALRHPDRCQALVLISAISQPHVQVGGPPALQTFINLVTGSDFVVWVGVKLLEAALVLATLIPPFRNRWADDPEKIKRLRESLDVFPVSERRAGVRNDAVWTAALTRYPLEQISVPTLAVYGTADSAVPYEDGLLVARTVLGAQLVTIEGGEHLLFITHAEQVWPEIAAFLRRTTPRSLAT